MAKLEAAIAARRQEEELDRLKREQEKEATLRSQQKEKVKHVAHTNTPQWDVKINILYKLDDA